MIDQTVIVGAVAGLLFVTDRMGWLPKGKSSADAAAELAVADRKAERLQLALDAAIARAKLLEDARLSKPVLDALSANTKLQDQILQRLAAHNGSFKHMEQSWAENATAMRDIVNSVQTLAGLLAELHDIPMKGRP